MKNTIKSRQKQKEDESCDDDDDGHGLPKVSLGPTMPYPSTPCKRPPLKRLYGCFRGGHPQDKQPVTFFYPLGLPTPYAYLMSSSRDDHAIMTSFSVTSFPLLPLTLE
jgi:hypothetical protein